MFEHNQARVNRQHPVRRGLIIGSMLKHMGLAPFALVRVVTGGTIVRPAGGGMAVIEGGESRHVVKDDVILIPENTPHWYQDVEGSITYLEVRFNVPVK